MAERKVDAVIGSTGTASDKITEQDKTNVQKMLENIQADRTKYEARIAQVLDRGIVSDRLAVPDLPPDLYAEWVPDDPSEVARMEAMGFVKDDTYAVGRSLHSKSDGYARVGDVVCMIAPKWVKEAIDKQRQSQFERIHGKPGQTRSQKEEHEYKQGIELPAIAESRADSVGISTT